MDAVHSTRTLQACKPVLPVRPFAALPHDVAATPGLTPTDIAVLVALTFWARDKDHCWPSDARIGARIDRSVSTVQRSLRHLGSLGLVERVETRDNRTGRVIRLLWRTSDDRPPRARMTDPPRARMTDEGRRSVKGESSNPETAEFDQRQRSRTPAPSPSAPALVPVVATAAVPTPEVPAEPLPSPIPAAPSTPPVATSPADRDGLSAVRPPRPVLRDSRPVPGGAPDAKEQALAWLSSDDPILRAEAERRLRPKAAPKPAPATTAELLARLREDPSHVAAAAELLCREFDDRKSWSGFHAVAKRAWEGGIDPAVLVDALERASRPDVRNRGALFMTVTKGSGGAAPR